MKLPEPPPDWKKIFGGSMDEIVAFLGQEECRNLVDGFPAKGTALANLNDLHGRGLLGKSKIGRKFYLTWPTIYPT